MNLHVCFCLNLLNLGQSMLPAARQINNHETGYWSDWKMLILAQKFCL